ncbi:MAG: CoA ester lyase [Streptomycetaceae bacterium]|jgi:citrate lyase subunit beta/citryl-CoA lyase|nr:CoA ester lyase [Streptomycetaceae bacterium]NUS55432.1 CoA ester lyase [Streptomycetaceae bacterium]
MTAALRSHLYVPGDRPEVLAKAAARGADALIVDLEDAVPAAGKEQARRIVADFLSRAEKSGPALWVRINPGAAGRKDLKAVLGPAVAGICMAKAESAADVAEVAQIIRELEDDRGIPTGQVAISPLLESAAAVLAARDIAGAPRVQRLQVGEADLRAELGVEPGADERELLWVRSQVVLASAAAGIEPPVAPAGTNFTDLAALQASTQALRRLGYRGRACIHPAQLAVVHEVFTPSAEEVARARALVAGYEAAVAAGSGVFVDAHGRMVDLAVVRSAQRTVAAAR